MDTRLLKKIKKNWSIVQYTDTERNDGKPIFRALYKGKLVKYAWIDVSDPNNYRWLILGIAHNIDWEWGPDYWKPMVLNCQKSRKRPSEQTLLKRAKKIWP